VEELLQRHLAIEAPVVGREDPAEPAAAEDAAHLVARMRHGRIVLR
jgi:hypothetical protein